MDKLKENTTAESTQSSKAKKSDRVEEQVKNLRRDLSQMQAKSSFLVGIVLLSIFFFLNRLFYEVIVAKLPFEPIFFVKALSHRNIPGEDFTDCSAYFIYALCSVSFRPTIQRALGFAVRSEGPSMWEPPK